MLRVNLSAKQQNSKKKKKRGETSTEKWQKKKKGPLVKGLAKGLMNRGHLKELS